MPVQCVKTIIGEDLIGTVTENLDGSITIERPFLVFMNQNPQGGIGIGLMPYLPFAEEKKFTYRRDQYLFSFNPSIELENEYRRLTSNIVIAQQTPKLTLQ